jgi:hypothetical protein
MLRGLWVFLLPLLLALTQHGAVLHELGHQMAGDAAEQNHSHHGQGPCQLCQAFAHQVGDLAGSDPAAAVAAPALRFHHAEAAAVSPRTAATPAQRNRGPPVVA